MHNVETGAVIDPWSVTFFGMIVDVSGDELLDRCPGSIMTSGSNARIMVASTGFGCLVAPALKTQDKPRPVDPSPQVPAAFTSQLDDPPFASNVRSLFLPARPLIAEGLDSGAARPLTGDVLAEIRAKSFESDE
ncbi:MAG: hypothetical protein WAT56_16930 [Candidatus Microthrix parvicella]